MGAPFRYAMPVRFADVDHAGIVYYPVFLHYFHLTFEEFFRAKLGGRSYVKLLDERRIGFPSVSARCDFRYPLRFGDLAEIEMAAARIGRSSATFRYRIFRAADPEVGAAQLAAEGENTCAIVDLKAFRAVEIPPDIRLLLEGIAVEDADGVR